MSTPTGNRPLTGEERALAQWMLEHGNADAKQFIPQLELAEVTPYRCPCGCATIDFQIKGHPPAPPGVHILADFVFGDGTNLSGIFIYEKAGLLSGLEVYGLAGDAPKKLPSADELRPFSRNEADRDDERRQLGEERDKASGD
jgi:hypothetical protein